MAQKLENNAEKHGILTLDLASGRSLGAVPLAGEAVAAMAAPVGRGMVVLATASGKIQVADPRARLKVGGGRCLSCLAASYCNVL